MATFQSMGICSKATKLLYHVRTIRFAWHANIFHLIHTCGMYRVKNSKVNDTWILQNFYRVRPVAQYLFHNGREDHISAPFPGWKCQRSRLHQPWDIFAVSAPWPQSIWLIYFTCSTKNPWGHDVFRTISRPKDNRLRSIAEYGAADIGSPGSRYPTS